MQRRASCRGRRRRREESHGDGSSWSRRAILTGRWSESDWSGTAFAEGEACMTPMALLLNLLWLLFGGVWMAVAWGVAAVIMAITIIGLPWARAAFNIGVYTLLPFGFKAVDRDEHFGRGDIGTGPLGVIGNVEW